MKKILAIECSGESASVALLAHETVLKSGDKSTTYASGWLLPEITRLLAEAGWAGSALDAIAFGAGPGSFTGLRLACGVAQGLALGWDKPVIGVNCLEAVAHACKGDRVWVALDARMSEIYCASYHRTEAGELVCDAGPHCVAPELVELPAEPGFVAAGTALAAYADVLAPKLAGRAGAQFPQAVPTAAAIGQLAHRALLRGEAQDATLAAPLYVRDKVALTTRERLARGGQR